MCDSTCLTGWSWVSVRLTVSTLDPHDRSTVCTETRTFQAGPTKSGLFLALMPLTGYRQLPSNKPSASSRADRLPFVRAFSPKYTAEAILSGRSICWWRVETARYADSCGGPLKIGLPRHLAQSNGKAAYAWLIDPSSNESTLFTPPSPVNYPGFPCYSHDSLTTLLEKANPKITWKYLPPGGP